MKHNANSRGWGHQLTESHCLPHCALALGFALASLSLCNHHDAPVYFFMCAPGASSVTVLDALHFHPMGIVPGIELFTKGLADSVAEPRSTCSQAFLLLLLHTQSTDKHSVQSM